MRCCSLRRRGPSRAPASAPRPSPEARPPTQLEEEEEVGWADGVDCCALGSTLWYGGGGSSGPGPSPGGNWSSSTERKKERTNMSAINPKIAQNKHLNVKSSQLLWYGLPAAVSS